MNKNTIKKFIGLIIAILSIYFILFSVVIFSFKEDITEEYIQTHKEQRFYSDTVGVDRAIVVDTAKHSVFISINMVQNASETLDISYYSMEKGKSTEFFFGLLLDAADRGVKVRIILDGMANGVKGKQNEIIYAMKNHPNIEFKLYEPMNIFMPWTINNRLHDKYIIADNRVVILGGRNIGDRYWGPDGYDGELTYDRDILIYNSDKDNKESVLPSITQYFEEVFYSKFAKEPVKKLSKKKIDIAIKTTEELKKVVEEKKGKYPQGFLKDIDWGELTYETNKVTLIHNPVTRFSKEPWVLYEIVNLMMSANKEVFIQSPYIVPPKDIIDSKWRTYVKDNDINVDVLTNSEGSTPNYPAFSAYLRRRDNMLKSEYDIYEYNGEHSIHSKTYTFDNRLIMVGSFNLDPRSSYLSTETMLVVDSTKVIDDFNVIKEGYLDKSLLVGKDGNYIIEEGSIATREIGLWKDILLKIVGFFTMLVEFLL